MGGSPGRPAGGAERVGGVGSMSRPRVGVMGRYVELECLGDFWGTTLGLAGAAIGALFAGEDGAWSVVHPIVIRLTVEINQNT